MNLLLQKLNGFKRRIRCIPYGMFYWRNVDFKVPKTITVNGKNLQLRLELANIHEFTLICLDDCYHLHFLKKQLTNIKNIVDVGANCGMFLLAARQQFPTANITLYEPNPKLEEVLTYNAKQLNAAVYAEAVMEKDCRVQLNFAESDLATTASASSRGNIKASSLKTLIQRHGRIDLLKLDCEGAEWGLLIDKDPWKYVKAVVMEYHLWAMPNSKKDDLFNLFAALNFKVIIQENYSSDQGFILAINRSEI